MGSPLLKELLVLAALLLVTPSLAGQLLQGQTKQRLRQDTRRAVDNDLGRGNVIPQTPVGGGRGTVHSIDATIPVHEVTLPALPADDPTRRAVDNDLGRGNVIPQTPVGSGRGTVHSIDATLPVHGVTFPAQDNDATLQPADDATSRAEDDISAAGLFDAVVFDGNDSDRTPLESTRIETEYIGFCQAEFLSEDVKGDGIISQTDFANTLFDLCEAFTVDTGAAGCPQRAFSSLAVKLQLIFAFQVCRDDDPMLTRMRCLQGLENMDVMGMEIGYMVTTPEKVQMEVNQLCFRLFQYSFPELTPHGGTSVPSSSPTDKPTDEPSALPSSSPSTTPPITPPITTPEDGASDTEGPTPTPLEDDADVPADADSDEDANSDEDPDNDTDVQMDSDNDGDGTGIDSVNGEEDPSNTRTNAEGDNSVLSAGSIIGIAAAATACLLCCILVACRRRNDNDTVPHKEMRDLECDWSVSTVTPNLKFFAGSQMDVMADTGDPGSITSSSQKSYASSQKSFNKRSILQFDPTAAASIAMGKRVDDASSSNRSSIFNRSGVSSGTASVAQITKAIDKANWDEVYNLASQMAEQEDLSTLSSVGRVNSKRSSSTSELSKTREALSPEDQERTIALDQLVDNADWTGVAVTAALYAGESGSTRGSENSSTQRSFLDILTGKRGTSTAAAAATEQDTLSALPVPFGNALGAFTDDTRSATTDEPGSFDLYSPSWTQPAPSSPVLRTYETPPIQAKRSRAWKGAPGIVAATSSSSSVGRSVHTTDSAAALGPLKADIDRAVEAGDWEKVLMLSSRVESNEAYQANLQALSTTGKGSNVPTPERASGSGDDAQGEATTASLKESLNQAVYHGDWALVTFFANRIISDGGNGTNQDARESTTSSTTVPQSTALVPFGMQAARSVDTTDTELGKKQTIEKLVLAEKWKGVSIMAGLYDLELKGSSPAGDAQSRVLVQSDKPAAVASDGKSAGWTDIMNRGKQEITPQKPNSPGSQRSPPPQIEREEIHLRKVAGNGPEGQQRQSEYVEVELASRVERKVPPTELRHADRLTGDISLAQFTAPQLREAEVAARGVKRDSQNRSSLHGTLDLIPYWKKREEKNAGDDARPAAK